MASKFCIQFFVTKLLKHFQIFFILILTKLAVSSFKQLMNSNFELFSTILGFLVNPIELPYRDIFSNVFMGYNETDNITSTIGLTTSYEQCGEHSCLPVAVEMPWPDWYEQYSNTIMNDAESRAAWKEVLSNCFGGYRVLDTKNCINQHGNEKVLKMNICQLKSKLSFYIS